MEALRMVFDNLSIFNFISYYYCFIILVKADIISIMKVLQ